MKKEIQSIYFEESNDNYYIEHKEGIDVVNRKEIKEVIYSEKFTLKRESDFGGEFFIYRKTKDKSAYFSLRNFLNKPFYHFLALLQKIIIFFGIIYTLLFISELDLFVFSIKSSFGEIFLGYIFLFLVPSCFWYFYELLDLRLMKTDNEEQSYYDRNVSIFTTGENRYHYKSSFKLLNNLFYTKGVKIRKDSTDSSYLIFILQVLSVSLFVWFLYYVYDSKILISMSKNFLEYDFRGELAFPDFNTYYKIHSKIENKIHSYLRVGFFISVFIFGFLILVNILVFILLNIIVFFDYLMSVILLSFNVLVLKKN